MKILLFITSVYNTLNEGEKEDYEKLINNLEKIKEINNDNIIYVSFCDNTLNKDVILFHIRKMIDKIRNKTVYLGEQFLGDVHYKDINSGSILYQNKKLNKIDEIVDYVKRLEKEGNEIELIIADGDMNVDEYEAKLKSASTCPCAFIYNISTVSEINDCLEELYNITEKKLQHY